MKFPKRKLAIVGVGHVGSAVLNCALAFNLAADIALIDIKMPGMDGIEVASQLKLIGILTVLMTAYSPAEKFL